MPILRKISNEAVGSLRELKIVNTNVKEHDTKQATSDVI